MTNDITVVEQLLQSSYNLFKTSSTPEKRIGKLKETNLVDRSPKTLALMKNDYEIDFMNEIEEKKLNHMHLVEELKTCELWYQGTEQTDDITKTFKVKEKILKEAIVSSETDIAHFYNNGQETARKLDEVIVAVNEKDAPLHS